MAWKRPRVQVPYGPPNMKNLRKDEILDQRSYSHKIKAQKYGAKADSYRYIAYSTRSKVNGLFAKALKLKEQAYRIESKTDNPKDLAWKKVYELKKQAFSLETQANKLNSYYYKLKKFFYIFAEKEALEHSNFTALKAKSFETKININAPGECSSKTKSK